MLRVQTKEKLASKKVWQMQKSSNAALSSSMHGRVDAMLSEVKRWQRLQVELPGWHPETSPDSESTSHSDSKVKESWPLQSSNYRLTSKFLYLCCKNCSFADFVHSILAQIVHSIFLNS